jgi:hypothetical protein
MDKNLAATREDSMSIIVWPWAAWIIGFTSLIAAAVITVYAKEAKAFSKGVLVAIGLLTGIGLAFVLLGQLEVFEGEKGQRVFLIRKMAICKSKITKLKWSQVKKVDAIMGGELNAYNNTIHYAIEFETLTGTRIRCLETSDRKKIKQRVASDSLVDLHQDVHGQTGRY